jgi:hypothetical protein
LAKQNLGPPPSRPQDYVDVAWVTSTYPSYSATISVDADYEIALPGAPVDHTMFLLEVNSPNLVVVVSVPAETRLTAGTATTTTLFPGKTGFFGFRYSATAGAWFLLSATSQI